jgi:hypothetical protein
VAIINFYTKDDATSEYDLKVIDHCDTPIDWILKNIPKGQNFSVYKGQLSKEHEISRDFAQIKSADEVSVFLLPGTGVEVAYVVAAVLVVVALTVKPVALGNLNRTQQSPNNSLSDRNNKARPNQRIVDICGKVKSIPDVLSREYSRFVDDIEVRVGYYCIARNNLVIEDIKEGDTLMVDVKGSSAGVYGAGKSPNNSAPEIQIGDPINENVFGVTQSADAIGQTLTAPNANTVILKGGSLAFKDGHIEIPIEDGDLTENFEAGDSVNLIDIKIFVPGAPGSPGIGTFVIGGNTHSVIAVEPQSITFDITDDDSWDDIGITSRSIEQNDIPKIEEISSVLIGPFKMSSFKVNRLLVNVNALSGIYKEDSSGRKKTTVDYIVSYQKLDDNGSTVGPVTPVPQSISGGNSNEKGMTTDIDLGAATFVEWNVERVTPLDFDFNGTIVDEIKVNSVFGLSNIDETDFGNVTTIQTKRTNQFLTTATKTPELNCIATELVQKYEGGVFATEFTPNTQAMQSLIRLALDPFVGRRSAGELDLDLLVAIQDECETYFGTDKAGQFNYSFDSTSLSAQETFLSIGKSAFITLWREGRVLKGWFESPQSVPSMVFTHRSKQPNAETWSRKRNTSDSKDSIEFVYTDEVRYTKETLFFPEDKSGLNPLRVEMTGIKGAQQAFWQMMREFNKQKYQEITVDFGATAEGRFVKPNNLISVVKGSRVYTYDGYIVAQDGLLLTLSQDVVFTPNDTHSIILKKRDGSTESILVFATAFTNVVQLIELPSETIYTGNDELKTEFSFGNEARLTGQLMLPQSIAPSDRAYVKIKAINYSDLYYQDDGVQTGRAFSIGFDDGFS